ncbi:L,D-transpeptidase, partial [Ciceribacter sp. RN22]|uniref:L,D-transpeptidase n=1 Tax=Ciceribacter sp. RN22 TaxID=2954932 RepID=UPI002092FDF5|nr:L,D-transpeptidase [Ciceribacter sp. RN22]
MTLKNNASDSPHHIPTLITRRSLLQCGGLLSLGGCSSSLQLPDLGLDTLTTASIVPRLGLFGEAGEGATDYAAVQDEGYLLPAIPYQKVKARFRRQRVVDPTGEAPGTIVVVLQERHLYFVLPGGEAIRYGVGIGKDGFRWSGRARIQYKKKWPVWTPPEEMIQRRPDLVKYRSG